MHVIRHHVVIPERESKQLRDRHKSATTSTTIGNLKGWPEREDGLVSWSDNWVRYTLLNDDNSWICFSIESLTASHLRSSLFLSSLSENLTNNLVSR